MSATTKQARVAMEAMDCRPAGDCACCGRYCQEHWTEFDEDGICPTARKLADAVVEAGQLYVVNDPDFVMPDPDQHEHQFLESVADLDVRTCWCGKKER